ncbi:chitinase domain-containing protein 1 [Chrysoperla carnea]|uniref:chitinase domain-containing protein 1 n=1 Tax=Chrysoperla carnea TaxID=189513 RepID=UPI001D08EC54|nr:chitinase domain-containing protein 1 [Chrysoperla carnea]
MKILIIFVTFNILCAWGASKDKTKPLKGPIDQSVFERDLLLEFPSAKQILKHHQSYYQETDLVNFNGTVLGYVTPWNNHGYDVAKWFGNKFTHISPVWLQIHRRSPLKYEVTGTHDIDKGWMKDVKTAGRKRKTKILPRVITENWHPQSVVALMSSDDEREAFITKLISTCIDNKFDGLVIEMWAQWARTADDWLLIDLIKDLGLRMKHSNLDFILVIPPMRGDDTEIFDATHFDQLSNSVTAFSLMTYDYSNIQKPGPNSPIDWIKLCVESLTSDTKKRKLILIGLNFYGYDYTSRGGGPIVAHEYLKLLKSFKGKLSFNKDIQEHHFELKNEDGRHYVFYPTLLSIKARIDLAVELDTGLSIWELGQGLDYFYDLL